eukprot:TRINITY_DN1819_c0_g1_i1.p1 TRINITY_DN1819_c0_g1~~TRINITY_DN1819_c0_g1_i1.p1  ORF type:complete len:412 (-),score=56.13 TRINITY_DN1819_c0_g1_i1:1547-2782(-)
MMQQPNMDGLQPVEPEIFRCVDANDVHRLEGLLTLDSVSMDDLDSNGASLLHRAAARHSLDVAAMLLRFNSRKRSLGSIPLYWLPDRFGRVPVHYAALEGDFEMIHLLSQAGSPTDVADRSGFTPLHLASQQGHLHCVHFLVSLGTRINRQDREGQTALTLAAAAGHTDVAELLLMLGANPSITDATGRMAIHWAALIGQYDLVKALCLRQGPAVQLHRDGGGRTAFDLACGSEQRGAETAFREYFADHPLRQSFPYLNAQTPKFVVFLWPILHHVLLCLLFLRLHWHTALAVFCVVLMLNRFTLKSMISYPVWRTMLPAGIICGQLLATAVTLVYVWQSIAWGAVGLISVLASFCYLYKLRLIDPGVVSLARYTPEERILQLHVRKDAYELFPDVYCRACCVCNCLLLIF